MSDIVALLCTISAICGVVSVMEELETKKPLTVGRLILIIIGLPVWVMLLLVISVLYFISWFFTKCKLTTFLRKEL